MIINILVVHFLMLNCLRLSNYLVDLIEINRDLIMRFILINLHLKLNRQVKNFSNFNFFFNYKYHQISLSFIPIFISLFHHFLIPR